MHQDVPLREITNRNPTRADNGEKRRQQPRRNQNLPTQKIPISERSAATYQPFNQMSDNNSKREFTRSDQSQPKSDTKRFDGKCFYCGKQGHRKQECRGRQRDEANGINKPDAIQPIIRQDEDKPKYNPKLVC